MATTDSNATPTEPAPEGFTHVTDDAGQFVVLDDAFLLIPES